jgi:hypothetical protein
LSKRASYFRVVLCDEPSTGYKFVCHNFLVFPIQLIIYNKYLTYIKVDSVFTFQPAVVQEALTIN